MKQYHRVLSALIMGLILLANQVHAQRKAEKFDLASLHPWNGEWKGKLTYLDYSSGKPYTILAHLSLIFPPEGQTLIMGFSYPDEPHANDTDTISVNAEFFGNERITGCSTSNSGTIRLVTERRDKDGNEGKMATIRHIYLGTSDQLSISKEVLFDGTGQWIERNAYVFRRR